MPGHRLLEALQNGRGSEQTLSRLLSQVQLLTTPPSQVEQGFQIRFIQMENSVCLCADNGHKADFMQPPRVDQFSTTLLYM